jgi:regulatory protein YycI of two-component signal transduction system YycFG
MKNFNLKKHFFKIVLLIFGIYLTFNYFDNNKKIANLHYGIKANALRKSLNVPIIDEYMKAESKHDEFFGNRWKSWREKPNSKEILHAWKVVTPSENKQYVLDKEMDAYRMKNENGIILQLNIFSEIYNDSILTRTGIIVYHTEPRRSIELNEKGVDSVVKSWNLNYLIKK